MIFSECATLQVADRVLVKLLIVMGPARSRSRAAGSQTQIGSCELERHVVCRDLLLPRRRLPKSPATTTVVECLFGCIISFLV